MKANESKNIEFWLIKVHLNLYTYPPKNQLLTRTLNQYICIFAGAQSNGCKFNKKPLYRYSGCHGYDASAFNIVLGLTSQMDNTEYSLPSDSPRNIFYKETLEQATRILESRRRNSSETSDHPFTDD